MDRVIVWLAILWLSLFSASIHGQEFPEPVLERYSLFVGQDSDGVNVDVADNYFGAADTRARIRFRDSTPRHRNLGGISGRLSIDISRVVPPETIVFALLCNRVEIRGFDSGGTLVLSRDLPAFTFGDSQSGHYVQTVRAIPLAVGRLDITFFGNYE
jgi:hypothetical protein